VDSTVKAMGCKRGDGFEQTVLEQVQAVPQQYITSLIDDWQGWMKAVIKSKGYTLMC
jgi:hypothetical protein